MNPQAKCPDASLIAAATGAPECRLALLENLMRDEVFHSTLDWQSAEELTRGAREAHNIYRSAPAYYDGLEILRRAEYRFATIETRMRKAVMARDARKVADLEVRLRLARDSVLAAREAIPRLEAFYQPT
jgi:hypothetical protein